MLYAFRFGRNEMHYRCRFDGASVADMERDDLHRETLRTQGKQAANDANARDAVYYFHNNVSGLPEELTDAGGDLVWQARYKVWSNAVQEEWVARAPQRAILAWGEVQEAALPLAQVPRPQNLRFQGEYLDRETGLHYNLFRYYDPDIGRFITPDPIGLSGGA
nr:RHS repeat-associated core domain-containing protein [Burkholderia cepacia]